jgi:hypothetical protein
LFVFIYHLSFIIHQLSVLDPQLQITSH